MNSNNSGIMTNNSNSSANTKNIITANNSSTTNVVNELSDNLLNTWYASNILPAIIGSVGNFWFTILIVIDFKLRNKPNYRLMLSVTIADWVICSICVPYESTQIYWYFKYNSYMGNRIVCMVESSIFMASLSISNLSQMMIALLRLMAVLMPLVYRRFVNIRLVTLIIIVFVLIPVIAFYYAGMDTLMEHDMDYEIGDCKEQACSETINLFSKIIFQYMPVMVGSGCYLVILMLILLTPKGEQRIVVLRRARGCLAMCINMTIFTTCVVIYWVFNNVETDIAKTLWRKFGLRATYCTNPIFYATLDSNLRIATWLRITRVFGIKKNDQGSQKNMSTITT